MRHAAGTCREVGETFKWLLYSYDDTMRLHPTSRCVSAPAAKNIRFYFRCRELGDTFKLLYSDGDTMWLRPNPERLLRSWDAAQPHVITGA